ADPAVSVDELIADPAAVVRAMPVPGGKHDKIALPAELYGKGRLNSAGLDLSNEAVLAKLAQDLAKAAAVEWQAAPVIADGSSEGERRPVLNPADHRDMVGT